MRVTIVGRESLGLCHAKKGSCSNDAWVSCGSEGKEGRVDAGLKVVMRRTLIDNRARAKDLLMRWREIKQQISVSM